MKYLCIDYGESKVGLALGDDETRLALPFKILKNAGWEKLFLELKDIVRAESIDRIIVGLPLNTRGESSEQTQNVRKFAAELANQIEPEITLADEMFSSQAAKKLGAGRREFRKDRRDDDVAAMVTLQSYFDQNL